nr:hypothetical protein [Tanacetum cinerariifolium]
LMNDLKRNRHFPEKIANNLKFLNNLQPEWSRHVTIIHQTKDLHTADYTQLYDFLKYNQKENYIQQPMPNPEDITDPTTVMNMALALMAKAFKMNYSSPTNNNQRISSNPRNRQIAQPGMNMGQDRQMQMVGGNPNQNLNGNGNLVVARAEGNAAGQDGNQIRCYNCRGVSHYARNCTVGPRRRDAAYLQTQLLIAQKEGAGIQLQAEEFDLTAAAADLDEIKEYSELLEPIPEQHQVPQNGNNVISDVTSMEQGGEIVEQHPVSFDETRALYDSLYQNLASEVEKVNSVNRKLKETNADLTTELARFKNQEKCFEISQEKYDKLERCYQQSVYQEQCLSKKINALYLIPQAQNKQQSLHDGKVLLENHDPPVVHDSEETLQLAQESREKMKLLNKKIKTANYTKINHLSGVFFSQTAKSREELYFSNDSKTANVSKSISIPNEEFSDDTTPSVAHKFLNEVKSTIVTLQRLVKHRMTVETHNWSSSAHQELHKIIKDEIFPIVNQVDAIVQNFEIQFLKEAAKFVGDFKSLAKEADESLAKHKVLELEIERLLRAVKLENENVELEFQVLNYARENAHLKATYKNLFDSISVSRTQTKTIIASLQNKLKNTIYKNAKLRTQLFKKVSDQKDNTSDTSENTKFTKQSIMENLPKVDETHALSKSVTSNSDLTPQESKVMKNDKKAVVVTSDPLALVAEKTKVRKRKEKVKVKTKYEGSDDDDISDLKKITALLAKAFNQKKYYAKPTNNKLRISSASSSANEKPEYTEGHFAKDCKKAKVKDYNYYKTKMLLAKRDSDEQVLLVEDQAWMESSSDSDKEINANMVFMAKMEKVLLDSDESSSSAKETSAEVGYYT